MNGRPPKPTSLKVLHGDRPDRINTAEPMPATTEIVPPEWLPAAAIEVWNELAADLIAKGVLTVWDVGKYAEYCWLTVEIRRLMKQIETEGSIVPGDKGVLRKHPAWQLLRDSMATTLSLSGRFGLTPSDRARLSIPGEQSGPEAERLLS